MICCKEGRVVFQLRGLHQERPVTIMRPTYTHLTRQIRAKKHKNKEARLATPIRWKQRSRALPYGVSSRPDTPLRSLALSLTQAARAALTEPYMLTVEHQRIQLR